MEKINWLEFKYFTEKEFECQHTGKQGIKKEFLQKLTRLREMVRRPLVITSGYRHETHPIEAKKIEQGRPPGVHTMGIAVDIACNGQLCYEIMRYAVQLDFKGIGISQRGNARFIHLDTLEGDGTPRPNIWSY